MMEILGLLDGYLVLERLSVIAAAACLVAS